ncbi:hypothetical protein DL98DRAFT_535897 [Cadophora sp. DSE1049]|nr:hypothetical protein DL98DRAFT_535897 [Cadophora sp. DSE1049]
MEPFHIFMSKEGKEAESIDDAQQIMQYLLDRLGGLAACACSKAKLRNERMPLISRLPHAYKGKYLQLPIAEPSKTAREARDLNSLWAESGRMLMVLVQPTRGARWKACVSTGRGQQQQVAGRKNTGGSFDDGAKNHRKPFPNFKPKWPHGNHTERFLARSCLLL